VSAMWNWIRPHAMSSVPVSLWSLTSVEFNLPRVLLREAEE